MERLARLGIGPSQPGANSTETGGILPGSLPSTERQWKTSARWELGWLERKAAVRPERGPTQPFLYRWKPAWVYLRPGYSDESCSRIPSVQDGWSKQLFKIGKQKELKNNVQNNVQNDVQSLKRQPVSSSGQKASASTNCQATVRLHA